MIKMAEYPDKFFDLAIVDPPYGIGEFSQTHRNGQNKSFRKHTVTWNNSIPPQEYFIELKRVSKNQIIWGANYYNCFDRGGAIIWNKNNPHPNMSQCEIASCSINRNVKRADIDYYGFVGEDKCFHPCAKPIQLYKWILKNYAKPTDKIIDTHLGSGSSAIAAYDFGCDFTGCEIDKDYYDAAVKRFNIHKMQQKLF
jgi:site-specific DNA-methyltransferase (adenine-specific)